VQRLLPVLEAVTAPQVAVGRDDGCQRVDRPDRRHQRFLVSLRRPQPAAGFTFVALCNVFFELFVAFFAIESPSFTR
jgi:hypothetical protein